MKTTTPGQPVHGAPRGGFTILELMLVLIMMGLLLGLVFLGYKVARKTTQDLSTTALMNGVVMGLEEFKTSFGFVPPLVKDKADPPVANLIYANAGRNTIRVYQLGVPADVTELRTLDPLSNNTRNPFLDTRYSTRSIAFYLAGGLETPYAAALPDVVIDGVPGPGMYAPDRDGTFEVPSAATLPAAGDRSRVGKTYEPFVKLDASASMTADPGMAETVEVRDKNGVAIRYYRWLNAEVGQPNAGLLIDRLGVRTPTLVGRDSKQTPFGNGYFTTPPERDLNSNAALSKATWAVVAAGPNKLFGDEDIGFIAATLGKPVSNAPTEQEEHSLRSEAEKDNVVRVGS